MATFSKLQLTLTIESEEEMLQKIMQRERDKERQRLKRMNPEYRQMERERDRNRKRLKRAHEAYNLLYVFYHLISFLFFF